MQFGTAATSISDFKNLQMFSCCVKFRNRLLPCGSYNAPGKISLQAYITLRSLRTSNTLGFPFHAIVLRVR
jgi:hypothetical protein